MYSFKVLKYKKLPPPGNGFPFPIKSVKYRDHFTFGIFGMILSVAFIILGVNHLHVSTKLFGI